VIELDRRQRVTLVWAGLAVVLGGFEGSILVIALPAIASEFKATTSDVSGLGSVLEIGALAALPLAAAADRFGRRRFIALGVAGFSLLNFASAFAPTLAYLALLKLFAVGFEALVVAATTALIVEEAPPTHRGLAVSVLALLAGAGMGVTVLAYPVLAPHWRWLFIGCGGGIVAAPLIWLLLPEGRRWTAVRHEGSAVRLLLARPWLRRLVVLAAMTALVNVLLGPAGFFYTLFASQRLGWSPQQISVLIVVSAVAGAASYLLGGFMTDRYGRRGPAIALTVVTAGATSLGFASSSVGFFAGIILWSAFASASTPVFGSWTGELFPTRARATAEAIVAIAVALGGVAGLQLVARVAPSTGLGGAIELGGVAAVAGALLLFLLPETSKEPLPE
jgi:MFS transporter, SHS family, lactate transporter